MSNHHGSHRSSHHSRSRMHHSSSSSIHYQSNQSRSRTSSGNINNSSSHNINNSSSRGQQQPQIPDSRESTSDWSEHRSSSGKVYYYNTRTGVSQWEIPAELRPPRSASSESEISESSSIRQQQDKSPSPSASSNDSAQSDTVLEDKPLLTPSLAQYFKPELIASNTSPQVEELERQANQHAKDALSLSERILKESVDLKIARAEVHLAEIELDARKTRYHALQKTIAKFGVF